MEHRIGIMPPEPGPLRNDIIFDKPTIVPSEYDIRGSANAAEVSENPRLMIGARVVAAAKQALGPDSARTFDAGSSYES